MNDALAELRRTRRSRRLQDQEWFEVLYRVYLAALVGGGAILIASDRVDDTVVTESGVKTLLDRGPGVIGLVAVLAVAAGIRSGSNGGPIAVEAADVRHLLMAPVSRTAVLRRPVVQRLRTLAFAGAVVGGTTGQLAARRLPGSGAAWTIAGAAAGACSILVFAAAAVIVHGWGISRPVATAIGLVLVATQVPSALGAGIGPADPFGSLALWGMRQHAVDVIALVVTALLATGAVMWCGRLRVEALTRRADLVSQLRFAVTMQDLRTVIVLRRQLRNEIPLRVPRWRLRRRSRNRTDRSTPTPASKAQPEWRQAIAARLLPGGGSPVTSAVHRRGLQSMARMPFARIARTAALAVIAGLGSVAVIRGTTPALVGVGIALFAMSLELLEPLSQEIDHPDLTDSMPVERDRVLAHHLLVPALAVIPFALLGAAVVAAAEPDAAAAAFALAIPMGWCGGCGAVVSTIRDLPDPIARNSQLVPPEFAGFGTAIRIVVPLIISTIGAVPVIAMRELPEVGSAVRSAIAMLLVAGACTWWVRRRDHYRTRFRSFMDSAKL